MALKMQDSGQTFGPQRTQSHAQSKVIAGMRILPTWREIWRGWTFRLLFDLVFIIFMAHVLGWVQEPRNLSDNRPAAELARADPPETPSNMEEYAVSAFVSDAADDSYNIELRYVEVISWLVLLICVMVLMGARWRRKTPEGTGDVE